MLVYDVLNIAGDDDDDDNQSQNTLFAITGYVSPPHSPVTPIKSVEELIEAITGQNLINQILLKYVSILTFYIKSSLSR